MSPGRARGSVKCSEEPIETAGRSLPLTSKSRDVAAALLGDDPAVAVGEARLEQRAGERGQRAAAHPAAEPPPAGDEVADLDAARPLARLAQGEGPGEVARHPVVAERGQQRGARSRRRAAPTPRRHARMKAGSPVESM